MAATIKDIRRETGLSLATISKYLNGGNVLPENKVLIEKAIKDLHYEVNELARGLVMKRTRLIGVIAFDIESLFVGNMLHFIGEELRKAEYGLVITDSSNDLKLQDQNLQFLISKKVDGIIVLPIGLNTDFLKLAKDSGIPVVMLDRALQDDISDSVEINNREVASAAVKKLIEKGHSKIGFIGSDVEYTGIEREHGYQDAMNKAGLPILEGYIANGPYSFEHGYEEVKKMLGLKEPPTAFILGNYETTLGCIMAINELGLECPRDISYIGFDDMIVSQVVRPKPWLVVQPMQKICEKGVELLLNRIESKSTEPATRISILATIREGESIKDLTK